MSPRPSFWSGLMLGGLAVFTTLARRPAPAPPCDLPVPDRLLDFVSEAVVVCDAQGRITSANAAAHALLGDDLEGYARLCYPTGQPVPPGQRPLQLPLAASAVNTRRFLLVNPRGRTRSLDVSVRPLRAGGAAAIFQDVSPQTDAEAQNAEARTYADALRSLSRRLGMARTPEEVARAATDAALALGGDQPGARAFLYEYEADAKRLTRLASSPEDRPKRPRSLKASLPPTLPFDAGSPLHWAVYIGRQPFLGEEASALTYALPLLAGGTVRGHLALTASAEALAEPRLQEALALAAALAASALAARRETAHAENLTAQMAALGEIARLLEGGVSRDALCDAAANRARHVLPAEICTITLRDHLIGQ